MYDAPDPPFQLYDERYKEDRKFDRQAKDVAYFATIAVGLYGIGALIFLGNLLYLTISLFCYLVGRHYAKKVEGYDAHRREWLEKWNNGLAEVDGSFEKVGCEEWRKSWNRSTVYQHASDEPEVEWIEFVERGCLPKDTVYRWRGEDEERYALERDGRVVALVTLAS